MKKNKAGAGPSAIGRRSFLKFGAAASAAVSTLDATEAWSQLNAHLPAKIAVPASIDLHAHWTPQAYLNALAELRSPAGNPPNSLLFDLGKRIQWMDGHGVKTHVLTLDGGMPWQWVSPADGALLATIINDEAVKAHEAFPARFVAGIEMSIRDPELAIKELNRVAGKPGLCAVHLPNSIEGRDYLFEPRYAPLLARIEELRYPLLFHPLDGAPNIFGGAQRLGDPLALSALLNNTLGFPFETSTTATKFIVTGTLDKYPKLEIVLPHSGGAFPYIAGRVEHGLERVGFKLPRPFNQYVRRFHYDTLAYYPETLRFMINFAGADRVVIGSDNFAMMDVEYPNALVERLKLSPTDSERIFRGNAERLLHL